MVTFEQRTKRSEVTHVGTWRKNVISKSKREKNPRGRLVHGLDLEQVARSP